MMSDDFQKRVEESIRNPRNMGEMTDADAVGTVGNPGCGDMVRMWLKYKVENGQKVIDKASFQSFGCETAIAAASLATELIRGKTPEEAANMSGSELAADLGPLPPTKIHCTQLIEEALRSALITKKPEVVPGAETSAPASLIDSLDNETSKDSSLKLVFLDSDEQKR
ncbi:MAG: Iron-sulfur cluster assembly scaffold protein IscU [Verrucomicrobia subdivision 3 bacterium]|nr:Iron-sulfur cluster assembly scaffold protein IscU [Limisphaerales bacterium]MCS1415167.1 Iron-sulfur cluster assembly scaffold protein IscU [Limisphaerales bacterium]